MQKNVLLVDKKFTSENLHGPLGQGRLKYIQHIHHTAICIILLGLHNSGQGLLILRQTNTVMKQPISAKTFQI